MHVEPLGTSLESQESSTYGIAACVAVQGIESSSFRGNISIQR